MFASPSRSVALPPIYVLDQEYEDLLDVISSSPRATPGLALLWRELQRATIIDGRIVPGDLVSMNSVVHFTGLAPGQPRAARLVYPNRGARRGASVSVASSVGAALIGLRVGSEFCWTAPHNRPRSLRIEGVELGMPAPSGTKRREDLRQRLAEFFGTD